MGSARDVVRKYMAKSRFVAPAFLALAASVMPRTKAGFSAAGLHGLRVARHARTFMRFANTIGSSIDDRLDPLPCETLESFGDVQPGEKPSPFILNDKVVSPGEWQTFEALDRYKLLPLPLTISFCNALAAKLLDEKRACRRAAGRPEYRPPIKKSHIELSELSVAFFAVVLSPAEQRKLSGISRTITRDVIADLLPDTARVGAVLQMVDDMTDLIKDMRDELQTGMVAANSFLAGLGDGFDDCADFVARDLPVSHRPVPIRAFPQSVQKHWHAMLEEAHGLAAGIASDATRRQATHLMQQLQGPFVEKSAVTFQQKARVA